MKFEYKPNRVFWVSNCCSKEYFKCGTLSSEVVGSSIFFGWPWSMWELVYYIKKESKLNKLKLMVLFKTTTYWYTNSCNIILGSVVWNRWNE